MTGKFAFSTLSCMYVGFFSHGFERSYYILDRSIHHDSCDNNPGQGCDMDPCAFNCSWRLIMVEMFRVAKGWRVPLDLTLFRRSKNLIGRYSFERKRTFSCMHIFKEKTDRRYPTLELKKERVLKPQIHWIKRMHSGTGLVWFTVINRDSKDRVRNNIGMPT